MPPNFVNAAVGVPCGVSQLWEGSGGSFCLWRGQVRRDMRLVVTLECNGGRWVG